jgi:hypothetical protein
MAFCLPHRVDQLDLPVGHCLYVVEKVPCELHLSTYLNTRPPLITRVYVEAREVAFKEAQREVSYIIRRARDVRCLGVRVRELCLFQNL